MYGTIFVGLDVRKAMISFAVARGDRGGEVRHWGTIPNRLDHVRKLAEKLGAGARHIHFCYEAGPCGYGLHRQLTELGHDCMVVAPSLIPVKAGDRVKSDRRDGLMLAKLHRAGELTAVWVPDAAHEAMRDLVRARAIAVRVLGKTRQHLQGFLLRHGRIYAGKKGWTVTYRRWLTTVRFAHPAQQIVFQDYVHAVTDAEARVERLTDQIAELVPSWSLAPVVEAVQAMRGVAFIVAVTVVAEVGDFSRFANPRQLMAYQRSALGHRQAHHPPPWLRRQPAHPQAYRGSLRLDQDGGRDEEDQAARAGQGRLGLRLRGGGLQPGPPSQALAGLAMTGSTNCPLVGSWRIIEADLWDRDYLDLVEPATMTIRADGHGEIVFGAMHASLDVEYAGPMAFFTWAGFDEMHEVSGSGWAELLDDSTVEIEFAYHLGDEAVLKAQRTSSSTVC